MHPPRWRVGKEQGLEGLCCCIMRFWTVRSRWGSYQSYTFTHTMLPNGCFAEFVFAEYLKIWNVCRILRNLPLLALVHTTMGYFINYFEPLLLECHHAHICWAHLLIWSNLALTVAPYFWRELFHFSVVPCSHRSFGGFRRHCWFFPVYDLWSFWSPRAGLSGKWLAGGSIDQPCLQLLCSADTSPVEPRTTACIQGVIWWQQLSILQIKEDQYSF